MLYIYIVYYIYPEVIIYNYCSGTGIGAGGSRREQEEQEGVGGSTRGSIRGRSKRGGVSCFFPNSFCAGFRCNLTVDKVQIVEEYICRWIRSK